MPCLRISITLVILLAAVVSINCSNGIVPATPPNYPDVLQDVTPPWLNFNPKNVCVDGDYVFIAGGIYGLQIFNQSVPLPFWVNWIEAPGTSNSVAVGDGYAYVVGGGKMQIIDIAPMSSVHLVRTMDIGPYPQHITVEGRYAYVICTESGLQIIDIGVHGSEHIVNAITTPWPPSDIVVDGGYAYIADNEGGLLILDVDPPETASIIKAVNTTSSAIALDVQDGYAYIASRFDRLYVIDIDPPDSAHIVHQSEEREYFLDLTIAGNYIYAIYDHYIVGKGLHVIDISQPSLPVAVYNIEFDGYPRRVTVEGARLYIADPGTGIRIFDASSPESSEYICTIRRSRVADSIVAKDGYVYIGGLQIIDVDPPEEAKIVTTCITPGSAGDVAVDGCYAYVADGAKGLQIFDISSPESVSFIKNIQLSGPVSEVEVENGYAYTDGGGLWIIDVSVPQNARWVNTVGDLYKASDLEVKGGYAYVAVQHHFCGTGGVSNSLRIYDVDPPESAHLVISVPDVHPVKVTVDNGYAYIPRGSAGLQIVDVDPPESAHIAKDVEIPGMAWDIEVVDGFAYLVDLEEGIKIIDVSSPESAHLVGTYELPYGSISIAVADGYAYVMNSNYGFRIIKLSWHDWV